MVSSAGQAVCAPPLGGSMHGGAYDEAHEARGEGYCV